MARNGSPESDCPCILLVEDEPLIRELAAEALVEAGFSVVEAADGNEALRLIGSEGHFDLLFTDIMLPGGADGWHVAESFRAAFPEAGVVYGTGYSPVPHRAVCDGVVFQKPYRLPKVIEALRSLGRRTSDSTA